jgi:hypothetical protein
MKESKIKYLILFFMVVTIAHSCIFWGKPCEKVEKKDIVGFYYSLNQKNNGKQYLQLFEDGRFINVYCDHKAHICDWGTWDYDNCNVWLKNMRYFNTPMHDSSTFCLALRRWINGSIVGGEDDFSFKKTKKKPKLACEK